MQPVQDRDDFEIGGDGGLGVRQSFPNQIDGNELGEDGDETRGLIGQRRNPSRYGATDGPLIVQNDRPMQTQGLPASLVRGMGMTGGEQRGERRGERVSISMNVIENVQREMQDDN